MRRRDKCWFSLTLVILPKQEKEIFQFNNHKCNGYGRTTEAGHRTMYVHTNAGPRASATNLLFTGNEY